MMTNEELNKIVEERLAKCKAEILNELQQPEKEWPQIGDIVYRIYGDGDVESYKWSNDKVDNNYFSQGHIHPTKEQAEFVRDMEKKRGYKYLDVLYRLHQFADEVNGDWVPDWKNSQKAKYYIALNRSAERIKLSSSLFTMNNNLPVFRKDATEELRERFTYNEIAHVMGVDCEK